MFPAKSMALLALVLAGQDQNTSADRFARELLKRAGEASLSATPVVASASLLRIGALTADWSREDGIRYVEAALQMSAAIPPEDARQVGGNIAGQSAALLAEIDLRRGLELIARTAPGQRSSLLTVIVQRMLETKQYAAACDALHQFGFDRPVGYRLISKALRMTPLSEDGRSLLLGRSSIAFQSDPNTEFGALLRENAAGFADSVLVDPVRAYVRWLLSAKPSGEEQERISVASAKGEVAFTSQYELELYRMMPLVLRLDPALAARIYEKSPGVKAVMERYPDGLEVAGAGGGACLCRVSDGSPGPLRPLLVLGPVPGARRNLRPLKLRRPIRLRRSPSPLNSNPRGRGQRPARRSLASCQQATRCRLLVRLSSAFAS